MSAICGIVRFDGALVEPGEIEALAASMTLRGPDGVGFHLDRNAGFAHLAFHVTPESIRERQPLVFDGGRHVLLADIRLDNRAELGEKLKVSRRELAELTDPEVLVLAYRQWGNGCVEHLLGDFVFAVWDTQNRTLFLARDPLGGFSLSYAWSGRTFYFASETAAILDIPEIHPKVNASVVAKVLAHKGTDHGETFFDPTRYLKPAHCMEISAGASKSWRYWDIDPDFRIVYNSDDEYTDHFLELLEQAVSCRLRTTGLTGLSLSGGSDSTLLAAIAARALSRFGQTLHSFSYVFDRFAECDERQYFQPLIGQYGISEHLINGDQLWTFANLATTPVARDFLWTNCYSQLPEAVARAAREASCSVLMDGMVGDALFCEPSLFAADLLRSGRLSTLLKLYVQHGKELNLRHELINNGARQLLPSWLRRAYRRIRPLNLPETVPWLTDDWVRRLVDLAGNHPEPDIVRNLSPGRRIRYNRLFQPMWAQGMAATRNVPYNQLGLERVSPYFDRRLFEFVMAIPTESLSHAGRPRLLQKNAMRRLLPQATWQREGKTGFAPLLIEGLLEKETETVHSLVQDSRAVQQGWIRQAWLASQLSSAASGNTNLFSLSRCLHLELWLRAIEAPLKGTENWSVSFRPSR